MKTDIHNLIERYFEGNTSADEEKILRAYFIQEDLPEELKELAPLFKYMDDEAAAHVALKEIETESATTYYPRARYLMGKLRTIAAVAAILLAVVLLVTLYDKQAAPSNGNYVWIDGQQITDPATVMKYAEKSFGKIKSDNNIIEEQLSFVLE